MENTIENLVNAVKNHADSVFSNGWDYISECYSDAEIAEEIKGCRTVDGAIRKMQKIANLYKEMQSNTRW
jgi:hypothetical protein